MRDVEMSAPATGRMILTLFTVLLKENKLQNAVKVLKWILMFNH